MGFRKQPARSTEESWSSVFRAMERHFQGRSVASITPEEAQRWATGLIVPGRRSARTVDNNYLAAANSVFGWAAKHKRIPRNPFEDVEVTVPRAIKLREKAFRRDECEQAWNKDPVFGVIGIQSGPRG